MRRFGLITSTGKEIDLTPDPNERNKIFFYQPDGLGYDENTSYRRVGQQWVLLDRYTGQGSISGTLIFMGTNPYRQFKNFVYDTYRDGLKLTYTVDEGDTVYKRNVIISSIGKTELNLGGYLECPITFLASTPWYTELTLTTKPVNMTANYGWIWDEHSTWSSDKGSIRFRSTVDMNIVINMKTNIVSPCALLIRGPINHPRWRHYVGTKLYEDGGVNCDVGSHNFLVIDNRTNPYTMKIYGEVVGEDGTYQGRVDYDNLISNVYSKSDFASDRFIKLRRGSNTIEVYSIHTPLTPSTRVLIGLEANIYHVAV